MKDFIYYNNHKLRLPASTFSTVKRISIWNYYCTLELLLAQIPSNKIWIWLISLSMNTFTSVMRGHSWASSWLYVARRLNGSGVQVQVADMLSLPPGKLSVLFFSVSWTDPMMHCFNICRRWDGSTSTWPAIISGAAAPRSVQVSIGH